MLVFLAFLVAAPDAPADSVFESPSGAITCTIGVGGASCYTDKLLDTPPPRSDRTDCGSGASAVLIRSRGVRGRRVEVCNPYDIGPDPVITLGYGNSIRVGRVSCRSSRSGMRCRNTRRHGFKVHRDGWRLF